MRPGLHPWLSADRERERLESSESVLPGADRVRRQAFCCAADEQSCQWCSASVAEENPDFFLVPTALVGGRGILHLRSSKANPTDRNYL